MWAKSGTVEKLDEFQVKSLALVWCSFLFIFLPPHSSASVFLPDLRQRHVDNGSGRKMIGRNMGIMNLAEVSLQS
jgi:hypothetical protein